MNKAKRAKKHWTFKSLGVFFFDGERKGKKCVIRLVDASSVKKPTQEIACAKKKENKELVVLIPRLSSEEKLSGAQIRRQKVVRFNENRADPIPSAHRRNAKAIKRFGALSHSTKRRPLMTLFPKERNNNNKGSIPRRQLLLPISRETETLRASRREITKSILFLLLFLVDEKDRRGNCNFLSHFLKLNMEGVFRDCQTRSFDGDSCVSFVRLSGRIN